MRRPEALIDVTLKLMRWVYLGIFMRPSTQRLNAVILDFAVRARGFNAQPGLQASGEISFISKLAKIQPQLCLDIGANTGIYSRALLEMTDAKVLSFEPLPSTFEQLRSLEQEFPGRLTCLNFGLANESGEKDLHYGIRSQLASFSSEVSEIGYVGRVNTEVMRVPVRRLDEFIDQVAGQQLRLDLIKIDTEGFEYEVLLGGLKLISKFAPRYIQIEFNVHHLFRNQSLMEIANLIPEYDAHQLLAEGRGMVARDVKDPLSNFFAYSNWVFVRRGN